MYSYNYYINTKSNVENNSTKTVDLLGTKEYYISIPKLMNVKSDTKRGNKLWVKYTAIVE